VVATGGTERFTLTLVTTGEMCKVPEGAVGDSFAGVGPEGAERWGGMGDIAEGRCALPRVVCTVADVAVLGAMGASHSGVVEWWSGCCSNFRTDIIPHQSGKVGIPECTQSKSRQVCRVPATICRIFRLG